MFAASMSAMEKVYFDKYDAGGAYHWKECDRQFANWRLYNPALDARYEITIAAIAGLGLRESLLDIGCGDGVLMGRVAPFIQRVVGVDSEPGAIRWAETKLESFPSCEVIHMTSYDLPFADRSFEIVTSADVIEHLKDPGQHLREACRVLKGEGALVLTTPKWRADRKWDVRHEKEYRAEELSALLSNFFGEVELKFFWPLRWSRFYSTRLGWRFVKILSLLFYNPFLRTTRSKPEHFGQMLAVCRKPLRVSGGMSADRP
jgi:2-polyprenyl-3-methyl-5-hydroxy-6-metoxy-1,4-benzoquinol methylase